jgi:hypothetical protein
LTNHPLGRCHAQQTESEEVFHVTIEMKKGSPKIDNAKLEKPALKTILSRCVRNYTMQNCSPKVKRKLSECHF